MTPVGIGFFMQQLVDIANALTVPAMTTTTQALDGTNGAGVSVPITAWQTEWPLAGNFTIKVASETMTVTGGHGTTTLLCTRAAAVVHLTAAVVSWVSPFAHVYEGVAPLDQSTTAGKQFIQRIMTDGLSLAFRGASRLTDSDTGGLHGSYRLRFVMYFGTPQQKARSLIALTSILEVLRAAWRDPANFTTAGTASSATSVTWTDPVIDEKQNPAFGTVNITVETRL